MENVLAFFQNPVSPSEQTRMAVELKEGGPIGGTLDTRLVVQSFENYAASWDNKSAANHDHVLPLALVPPGGGGGGKKRKEQNYTKQKIYE